MPFPFSYVCALLQSLEDNVQSKRKSDVEIIQSWFQTHKELLDRNDHGIEALLSTLLPDKRPDRMYMMKEKRLQAVIARGLILGRSRIKQLGRWSESGSGLDLATCVENILEETPNPVLPGSGAAVEEIDRLLHTIAAGCRYSSPAVRSSAPSSRLTDSESNLGELYRRLSAQDAKWLTRMILKNYEPVLLDLQVVYRCYDPYLPAIMKVQDENAAAALVLGKFRADKAAGKANLAEYLKPRLGVKIGRQPWFKGRSIKHCLDMGHGRMSCEEKLDGEYCQIHIDLSKGRDCIQIFSKSGKDSTRDRIALHGSIQESLQIGEPSCPIRKGCILEGELVVYSDKDKKILDFHKIRKHVSRSGAFLNTDQDSQRYPWEHLMVVYYDLFMVDDESLLPVRQSERFRRLKELITEVPGRSSLVKREIIDCDRRSARSDLRRAFARCIVSRGEGLVLKPDDPYFDFSASRKPFSCCAIKLKKEYIGNFGEIGDFAVVGARFDAARAQTFNIANLKWTHFYIGCLENKEQVTRFGATPSIVVTNVVELNQSQLQMFATHVNPNTVLSEDEMAIKLRIEPGIDNGKRPSFYFTDPPVFDIRCFSFDKEGNTGFWGPRFPMVSKIHTDRSYRDTISFQELQEMAIKEKEEPPPDDSQELLGWIAALEDADPRRAVGDMTSQSTVATTEPPTSPSIQSSLSQRSDTTAIPSVYKGIQPAEGGTPTPTSTSQVPKGLPTPPRSSAVQAQSKGVGSLRGRSTAGFLWVTEDLLGCHGIVDFARDPYEWAELPVSSELSPLLDESLKKAKRKKAVLVDTRRKEATTNFLARIQETGLTRRKGGRDWVPIFDWRVLEELREEEKRIGRTGERPDSRFDMSSGSSIWRKFWLNTAGFTNVTVIKDKWPLNPWPRDPRYKEIGTWASVHVSQGLEALSLMLFTHVLGRSAEEVKEFIVEVKGMITMGIGLFYGQKPEETT
ncbi:hypothetical protein OQA88_6368 [Cercophora sp. LCS_1]